MVCAHVVRGGYVEEEELSFYVIGWVRSGKS